MLKLSQILDSARLAALVLAASGVALFAGCGQRGPLFLPTGEAAAGRASLPQTLSPALPASTPASAPASAPAPNTATPAPRP
jgi:predicted small lipoprotein YifL